MKELTQQEAIIYVMVMVSASDRDMVDPELSRIGALVRAKPVFRDFAQPSTLAIAQACQKWLQKEEGFEEILDAVTVALPKSLRETAYAFAVDIAVSDIQVDPSEFRLLQILRDRFDLDRATVNAIELAAKIRHRSK
jgi:tellurite resistance protein